MWARTVYADSADAPTGGVDGAFGTRATARVLRASAFCTIPSRHATIAAAAPDRTAVPTAPAFSASAAESSYALRAWGPSPRERASYASAVLKPYGPALSGPSSPGTFDRPVPRRPRPCASALDDANTSAMSAAARNAASHLLIGAIIGL